MIRGLLLALAWTVCVGLEAQTVDDDIWREVDLGNVDFQKSKNYCQRLFAYFRTEDEGVSVVKDRQDKLYRIFEGIWAIDVRYKKDVDDGAHVLAARNVVHPDQGLGELMEYFELKPYTFLEKARRDSKRYTIEQRGDTSRVFTRLGLAGTVVRDTLGGELRMQYNALAPDTALTLNLLILSAHLSHVDADAVYRMDDGIDYVPQGQLKRITFEGDLVVKVLGVREDFHERCEIYVDSVAYLTRDEYRADARLSAQERIRQSGYTAADIDRLRTKHGVPPLSARQRQRIEEQRDWEDQMEYWRKLKE